MNTTGSETERTATPPDETTPHSTTRPDAGDNAPPMNSPARGPMDQTTPDVTTGSTPLTRRDD